MSKNLQISEKSVKKNIDAVIFVQTKERLMRTEES